jgi:hypothetical protein
MRRTLLICTIGLCLAVPWARAASPIYVSADVPTDETASGTTILPSEAVLYDGSVPGYAVALTVPGNPQIDAIHKMDGLGSWLFSLESASDLGGALPTDAQPRDVLRYDGASGTYSLCLSGAAVGIPDGANIDAVFLQGGDMGSLLVSFDVPTNVGAFPATFDPADLVRFVPTGVGVCGGWALGAGNPAFDASAAGFGIPQSSNVIGADAAGSLLLLSFDVPTDLGPPGLVTYVPGQLVSWDGAMFALYEPLIGWPISSEVDGIASLARAGTVPTTLLVGKSATPGDLVLTWAASCADGATDYGIYEGTLGSWYSHASIDCTDDGADLTEEITPAGVDTYYLLVAHNPFEEGSYGTATITGERPVGLGACATPQIVTVCPP